MKIKQVINVVIVLIMVGLLSSTIILYNENVNQKDNIEYLRHNLSVKDVGIREMIFKKRELEQYIANKDTQHKIEIDSLLKKHKIEIKNLISYSKITAKIIDVDTTRIVSNESKMQNDSTYRKEIKYSRKCLKISGYLLSKDSTTEAFITKVEQENKIYITKSYKKSFWDWLFLRKGKELIQTSSDCGELEVDNIIIK